MASMIIQLLSFFDGRRQVHGLLPAWLDQVPFLFETEEYDLDYH